MFVLGIWTEASKDPVSTKRTHNDSSNNNNNNNNNIIAYNNIILYII